MARQLDARAAWTNNVSYSCSHRDQMHGLTAGRSCRLDQQCILQLHGGPSQLPRISSSAFWVVASRGASHTTLCLHVRGVSNV